MPELGLKPHTFSILTNHQVPHGAFGRSGGISQAPYHALNVGLRVGDCRENVLENRRLIKEHLGLSRLVALGQVHGDRVLLVEEGSGKEEELPDYDAMICRLPGVGLMIQQADCQAVLLYDPENRAVANIHAGWRGSVQNIIAATLAMMSTAFKTRADALFAAISPSLGPCCGEFRNHSRELPAAFLPYQIRPKHFDFWAISRDQLAGCGVRKDRISQSGICTVCNPDYFSYRRDGTTGRCATVIAAPGTRL